MKNRIYIILFLLFNFMPSFSQNNLIYNPGFENGITGHTPQCDYNSFEFIEDDILDWKRASCSGLAPFYTCPQQYSYPDWMDNSCGSKVAGLYYLSRFIYVQKAPGNGNEDAIRTGLISHMNASLNYLFRITYTGVPRKNGQVSTGSARTRIYFTKYSTHWSSSWGNVKLSFPMYPPYYNTAPYWHQHWFLLNGPILNSIPMIGNIFDDLGNIVIDCEQGQFYVDYVELAEQCDDPVLIENHIFANGAEAPYKSSGILKAGYDVGSPQPNGNVTISYGADITFKAASDIYLENGFTVENGANFTTVIEPCNANSPYRNASPNFQVLSSNYYRIESDTDSISVFYDDVETLGCYDTVHLVGLDGDTVSYTDYWWDFGNGQTSTDKAVDIYYDQPGTYLVQLALTDTSGTTDTLSKTYIVPGCRNNNSILSDTDYKIEPNPSTGIFNFYKFSDSELYMAVFNISGQKIFETNITENTSVINLSSQPKGVYFIKVIHKDKNMVSKIVIQ